MSDSVICAIVPMMPMCIWVTWPTLIAWICTFAERQPVGQVSDVRELASKAIDRLAHNDVNATCLGVGQHALEAGVHLGAGAADRGVVVDRADVPSPDARYSVCRPPPWSAMEASRWFSEE